MKKISPKKGNVLIAEPSIIGDVSFNRSLIVLVDHNDSGTVGFIVNKPLTYSLNDLIPEVHVKFPLFDGGPVEQDSLFFIHAVPDLIENGIPISDDLYWGGDFQKAVVAINEGRLNTNQIKFFLGYSGWNPSQLNSELSSKTWILSDEYSGNHLIKTSTARLWREKMERMGGDYLLWCNAPENPSFN